MAARCASEQIEILIDVTGAVEFGAFVTLEAFRHGKHVILMNAELDATLGRGELQLQQLDAILFGALGESTCALVVFERDSFRGSAGAGAEPQRGERSSP